MATDVAKLPDSIDLSDALLSGSLVRPALAGFSGRRNFQHNWDKNLPNRLQQCKSAASVC
ncbi:MAG TPA: hypothetical protein VJU77_16895 [Chthoniobacterales bacterium]|nr:hypothetical protein [Chthoniobacterales bacterium]